MSLKYQPNGSKVVFSKILNTEKTKLFAWDTKAVSKLFNVSRIDRIEALNKSYKSIKISKNWEAIKK